MKCEGSDLASDLEEGAAAMRRAARDLREAIYDLRAYRDGTTDISQLFGSLLDLNRRRMPDCELEFVPEEGLLESLSGRGGTELLRIVQEALTNVRRHSGARRVNVAISSDDGTLRAEVSDDGRGFDPEALPPGVGTIGMRERALGLGGRIEVESGPGSGTMVRFVAPLGNLRR